MTKKKKRILTPSLGQAFPLPTELPLERPDCDVDNIVKPILDACKRIVYQDDRFVSEVCSHRVSLDSLLLGQGRAEELKAALEARSDFVHVRFEAAP